jgi:hypothetical protein
LGEGSSLPAFRPESFDRDPSPLDDAALVDEVNRLLRGLKPLDPQMLELRLQGHAL